MVTVKALARLEVRWVQVLRPMREEVEAWAADAISHPTLSMLCDQHVHVPVIKSTA